MKIKYLILTFSLSLYLLPTTYTQNDVLKLVDDWVFNQYNYNYALNLLNSYIESNPQSSEAYLKRAHIYNIMGKHVEEERDLELAYSKNPLIRLQIDKSFLAKIISKPTYDFDWLASQNQPNAFDKPVFNAFDYESYIFSLEQQVSVDSIILTCLELIEQSDFAQADFLLNEIAQVKNPIFYDLKGLIKLQRGDLETSILYFDQSIQIMPSFALAYHHRGIAHKLLGNLEKSHKDINKAIEINSEICGILFQ